MPSPTLLVLAAFLQLQLSANLVVAFLVLTFITVPTILLLLEHLRSRDPDAVQQREQDAETAGDAEVTEAAEEEPPPTLASLRSASGTPVEEATLVLPASRLPATPFRSGPPAEVAVLPPHTRARGDLAYRGYLVIGDGAVLDGDLDLDGELWVQQGAEITGDVHVNGDLHAAEASYLAGTVALDGDAYLGSWSKVRAIERAHLVRMAPGARVETALRARGLVHGASGTPVAEPMPSPAVAPREAPRRQAAAQDLEDLFVAWHATDLDVLLSRELGVGWPGSPAGRALLTETVAPLRPLIFEILGTVAPARPPPAPSDPTARPLPVGVGPS